MSRYRLYLDESGDHTVQAMKASDYDKRHLCLSAARLILDIATIPLLRSSRNSNESISEEMRTTAQSSTLKRSKRRRVSSLA
jgi:hypothetical protein